MKEVRFFYVPDAPDGLELPEAEAQHAIRVLRLREGDDMMLMDGRGNFYRAEVTVCDKRHCLYQIQETLPQERPWQGHLRLAIAPTKMMERMEWLVEKATEVGVDEFSFLDCQFSERRQVKTPRLENIVVSAMKQSRKAWKPVVGEMMAFKDFIRQHSQPPVDGKPMPRRYIAHCYEEVPRVPLLPLLRQPTATHDALVLVGPEGDFSIDEVRMALEAGFVSVDLGRSRLRTETAGLAAVMMMQLAEQYG